MALTGIKCLPDTPVRAIPVLHPLCVVSGEPYDQAVLV